MFKVLAIETQQTKFIVDSHEEFFCLIKLFRPDDCSLSMGKVATIVIHANKALQIIAEDTSKFTWYRSEEL